MFTWQFFVNYITFECLVKMVENSLLFVLSAYFSYTELPFANIILVFHISDCFNHILLPIYSKILSILPSQPLIPILCSSQAGYLLHWENFSDELKLCFRKTHLVSTCYHKSKQRDIKMASMDYYLQNPRLHPIMETKQE